MCDRCKDEKNCHRIDCYLCPLRGGPLKKAYVIPRVKPPKKSKDGSSTSKEQSEADSTPSVIDMIRQAEETAAESQPLNTENNVKRMGKKKKYSNGFDALSEEFAPLPPEDQEFANRKTSERSKVSAVWVHITCALAIPEVKFGDLYTKCPIAIPQEKPSRKATPSVSLFTKKYVMLIGKYLFSL